MKHYNPRTGVVRVPIGRNAKGTRIHKTKRVNNEAQAVMEIARIRLEFGEAGSGAFTGEQMTFDELLIHYKRTYPKKVDFYLRRLKEYFGPRRIRTINYADCLQFKAAREQVKNQTCKKQPRARKPATINREMEQLGAVLSFAFDNGWILRNPFKQARGHAPLIDKKKEKRRNRFPTPDEEARLLAVCVPPREHLLGLIIASLDTGLRRSALWELDWTCVDFHTGLLHIPEGKRNKQRPEYSGMTDRLETVLRDLYEQSDKNPNSPVFGQKHDFKHAWTTACKLAGIEGLRFNDLRHGYSTGMMEAGIPKHLAMKAAGHLTENIHDIYTNVDQRIALEIAAALNKLHGSRAKKEEYIN